MKSLSIIICTWNRADSLSATLASLELQQASGFDTVDVIVVDNNSTDSTADTVVQLSKTWKLGTLRYTFEARQGKQFALNSGIAKSHGDLLAFTDDDILFPDDWVACLFEAFENSPAEVAGGKTLLRWPEGGAPVWYATNMAAVLGGVDLGENYLLPPPQGYAPAGANLVARRSLFARVGLFSESHFRHMDYEFGLRCAQQHAVLAYIPSLVVWAPIDAAMLSKRYFRRWSFKAGISHRDSESSSGSMRVPRWLIRQLLQDMLQWPLEFVFNQPRVAFSRELRIWRAFGTVSSCWYAWARPHRYAEWVAHYSQKKKNLY
jgi:glycosyltransferase involved in cell wall biosynthesis